MYIKYKNVPIHIGIIMDGNRRWAKKHRLKLLSGHFRAADEMVEPIIERAGELGIKYLTFWCFSTENWGRKQNEVKGLMMIFRHVIREKLDRMKRKGARICVIGDLTKFPKDIKEGLEKAEEETKDNTKITVNFALGYGGRDEIVRAVNKWRENPKSEIRNPHFALRASRGKPKQIQNSKLTEEILNNYLDTRDQPEPDLIIRTGGEQRLSGFLTWQSVYSELYFTEVLFPDFTVEELEKAIREYARRQRRFGK